MKLHFARRLSILAPMNELEDMWPELLADAIAKARGSGRGDVADFLALRASNDLIRSAAVKWLLDTVVEVASRAQAEFPNLKIEREDAYVFRHRGADLTGSIVELRLGVRCLTIEAGWTRLPKDGFMRGGALAFARIVHFGMPRNGDSLSLCRTESGAVWTVDENDTRTAFETADLIRHFSIFLT